MKYIVHSYINRVRFVNMANWTLLIFYVDVYL